MKKIFYFTALLLCSMMVSCDKEEVGGTATEATAGQWYVTVDGADADGNVIPGFEDLYQLGRIVMLTFNTSANKADEMIVSDASSFWDFKVKVSCDPANKTFSTNTTENNNLVAGYEDINVQITNGKILPKAGKQNNGSPADSIVFYVAFSDDDAPADYGFTNYRVSGIRYSGLVEND